MAIKAASGPGFTVIVDAAPFGRVVAEGVSDERDARAITLLPALRTLLEEHTVAFGVSFREDSMFADLYAETDHLLSELACLTESPARQ